MTFLKKRNIFVMLLLTMVTCGIYGIYWIFTAISEMNSEIERLLPGEKTVNPVLVFFLSFITCGISMMYGLYIWTNNMKRLGEYYQVQTTDSTLVFLLAIFLGIGSFLIQNDMNKIAERVEMQQVQ